MSTKSIELTETLTWRELIQQVPSIKWRHVARTPESHTHYLLFSRLDKTQPLHRDHLAFQEILPANPKPPLDKEKTLCFAVQLNPPPLISACPITTANQIHGHIPLQLTYQIDDAVKLIMIADDVLQDWLEDVHQFIQAWATNQLDTEITIAKLAPALEKNLNDNKEKWRQAGLKIEQITPLEPIKWGEENEEPVEPEIRQQASSTPSETPPEEPTAEPAFQSSISVITQSDNTSNQTQPAENLNQAATDSFKEQTLALQAQRQALEEKEQALIAQAQELEKKAQALEQREQALQIQEQALAENSSQPNEPTTEISQTDAVINKKSKKKKKTKAEENSDNQKETDNDFDDYDEEDDYEYDEPKRSIIPFIIIILVILLTIGISMFYFPAESSHFFRLLWSRFGGS